MTPQQFFDAAVAAIRKQGTASSISLSGAPDARQCVYRGPNGLKCAAGHFIADNEYKPMMEGKSVNRLAASNMLPAGHVLLVHRQLAVDLQRSHDCADSFARGNDDCFFEGFEKRVQSVARAHDLCYTPPVTPVTPTPNFTRRERMKPELKAKWLEALRSGAYQQVQGCLKCEINDQPKFCCLGVLCDLTGLGEWRGFQANRHDARKYFVPTAAPDDTATGAVPGSVEREIGFESMTKVPASVVREVYLARGELMPDGVERYLREEECEQRRYGRDDPITFLAPLNDNGASFAVIADVIERVVPVEA
jgi:hypothetical protein